MTSLPIASPASRLSSRKLYFFAAVIVSFIITGFHFYLLVHAGGFWRDEVNMINVAGSSSLEGMTKDSFPLMMPLLIKGWMAAGWAQTDADLRLLGIFIGLGTLASLWIACWSAQKTSPLLSLILFGFNSTVIAFGDSLRGYGLGSLLILLSFAAACFFLQRPNWPRAFLLSGLFILSVQSLYHNIVLVAAISFALIIVCIKNKAWTALAQVVVAALIASVSLVFYLGNFAGTGTANVLRSGNSWLSIFYSLKEALASPWLAFPFAWLTAAVGAIGANAFYFRRKNCAAKPESTIISSDLHLFVSLTLLIATVGIFSFLRTAALVSQPWYFLPFMALAAVSLEILCATLPSKIKSILWVGTLAIFIISLPVEKRALNFRFTNVDVWAANLKSDADTEDFVIVAPWFCGITFNHYFHSPPEWETLPPIADHSSHRYDLLQKQMLATNSLQPVLDKITSTLRSGHRVWFLCPENLVNAFKEGVPQLKDLPSPPLPDSGWSPDPYIAVWAAQTVAFLSDHGQQIQQVINPPMELHIGENLDLLMVQGWKDISQTKTNLPSVNFK